MLTTNYMYNLNQAAWLQAMATCDLNLEVTYNEQTDSEDLTT